MPPAIDSDHVGRAACSRRTTLRWLAGAALLAVGAVRHRTRPRHQVWQLDPAKCVQCGRCATQCVLSPSAVKCVHNYAMCGYCDLCGGYHRPNTRHPDTAAENRLCPTDAIRRTFIEDPYFEYSIDEAQCIGCGRCVKGCGFFGNGSLYLQVRHDRCLNCNECAIAVACPAQAFRRVPADQPYLLKGEEKERPGTIEDDPGPFSGGEGLFQIRLAAGSSSLSYNRP